MIAGYIAFPDPKRTPKVTNREMRKQQCPDAMNNPIRVPVGRMTTRKYKCKSTDAL